MACARYNFMRSLWPRCGASLLLLAAMPMTVAQIRLVPPLPPPSLCEGLCDAGRCDPDTVHSSRYVEAACIRLLNGEERPAVGQKALQPPDLPMSSPSFSILGGSRWTWTGSRWRLPSAELQHAGGSACADALSSSLVLAGSPACDACRSWPQIEAREPADISAAVVELGGACPVQQKTLALRAHDVVLAIARRRVHALGLYSRQATRYEVPSLAEQQLLSSVVTHTPTVMLDKHTGLALLALMSFTNATLTADIRIQPNPWDVELFENWRWFALSVVVGPLWAMLLVLAVQNLRSHVRSHGVRVASDRVMQILLTVFLTALVHTVRGCWLWGRTSLGDLVSPWGNEVVRSLYLPLACLLPLFTGSRLEMGATRLRQIAKLAYENGELAQSDGALKGLDEAAIRRRKKLKKRRALGQVACTLLLLIASLLRMVERACNLTHRPFVLAVLALLGAASLILFAMAADHVMTYRGAMQMARQLAASMRNAGGTRAALGTTPQALASSRPRQFTVTSAAVPSAGDAAEIATLRVHLRRHACSTGERPRYSALSRARTHTHSALIRSLTGPFKPTVPVPCAPPCPSSLSARPQSCATWRPSRTWG